jgi:hypothetical protein
VGESLVLSREELSFEDVELVLLSAATSGDVNRAGDSGLSILGPGVSEK